ncbi:MAG: hypothetical protein AAFW73_04895 [Bacteroidota bacterium]
MKIKPMSHEEFTPEESLALITEVIQEAKVRLEEDGLIYMMWGILLFVASTGQYLLFRMEQWEINYYPYFLIPLGAIASQLYYARKQRRQSNQIMGTISVIWAIIGFNLMLLGFFGWPLLKSSLLPIILILLGIGVATVGQVSKSRVFLLAGILINITGFVGFQLDWTNQPLLLGISSLLFIFGPGLVLQLQKR